MFGNCNKRNAFACDLILEKLAYAIPNKSWRMNILLLQRGYSGSITLRLKAISLRKRFYLHSLCTCGHSLLISQDLPSSQLAMPIEEQLSASSIVYNLRCNVIIQSNP